MKRLFLCILSLVLAVGLAPFPALANTGENSRELQAGTTFNLGDLFAQSHVVGPADATFSDKNLYNAVTEQLSAQGIPYEGDASSMNVKLTAENNASFKHLNACHRHIKNISGLEQFTGLTWIDLSNNLVGTASQFAGMANLAYLDLYDNAVRDLAGLNGLTKLEHLNLGDNDERSRTTMTNLDALSTLSSLKWLDFSRNKTPEVTTHIKDLTTLEYLDLADNDLVDVYDLAKLTNMKVLILNFNSGLAGVSSLKDMTDLEELHIAFTHLNRSNVVNGVDSYGTDKSGINELFNDDGSLKLAKLRKFDLLCDWNTGFANDGGVNAESNGHVRDLYRMFKAGQLEEYGYFYTWFDVAADPNFKRTANIMHTDANGVKYIAYEDFDPHCDGIHDDYYAIFNAHMYANTYGCEVRATVNAADAPNKTFHIFNYHTWRDLAAYTNIDWQNANFVMHDENIDHYPSRHFAFLLMHVSPQGSTTSTSLARRMKTINNPTINAGQALNTSSTSIAGLSPDIDTALADLKGNGYNRFYVMVTDENKRQYMRHEGLDYRVNWEGYAQWDGFIVDGNGAIEVHNASKMLPYGKTELSDADYHSPDPKPVQWDFGGITKVEIVPIPSEQSYVKNANFVTMPLSSKAETPRDGGGKPADYRRCLDFRYCTNLEVANVNQTLGYAETNYDDNELSGSYYGFFTINYSADVTMHDCTAWDRRAETSTYGIQLYQIVGLNLTRVSSSNPEEHLWGIGGSRWGNTGTNYIKHIMYDHCDLGRIDAHMGYYDLAVRDCNLGTGGLCLTGQGPLTVERTSTRSQTFLNLRSDYGSTWDGDAHINDCTHYFIRAQSSPQPGNFSSSTPRFDDYQQDKRHDFGYPLRHPNLYVKNYTLDDRYFFGSDTEYFGTYGILTNYINGLQKYDDYWPEVAEIDGLHLVNYENSLGYERHVRMPLRMYGPILDQFNKGGYSIKNITYNGKPLSANLDAGQDLFDPTQVTLPFDLDQGNNGGTRIIIDTPFSADRMGSNDIVIEYTGDEPDFAFSDSPTSYISNDHWIVVKPYFVEHRWNADKSAYTELAYFSSMEINHRWNERLAQFPEFGPLVRIQVRSTTLESSIGGTITGQVSEGKTHILKAKLLSTHEQCEHEWGQWTQTFAPTCTVEGEEQSVCAHDSSHVQRREVAPLGHDWSAPSYEWSNDNTEVTATRTCSRNAAHVETETASTTYEITREATTTRAGEATYTAAFHNDGFSTQVKTVTIPALPPDGRYQNVTDVTDPDSNWGFADIGAGGSDLAASIPLTGSDQTRLSNGEEMSVWLEVSALTSDEVPSDEQAAANAVLDGYTVGAWFDASVYKQFASDSTPTKVEDQLSHQIAVKLTVPDNLHAPQGTNRTFAIVRIHDGSASLLAAAYSQADQSLTCLSDLFSTYALVYKDAAASPDPVPVPPAESDTSVIDSSSVDGSEDANNTTRQPEQTHSTNSTKPKQTSSAPKTGDELQGVFAFTIIAIACVAIALFSRKRAKRSN